MRFFMSRNQYENSYFAVLSNGWFDPTSFLNCNATFAISSLKSHRKLRKEVGYPTIFSASLTALFQSGFLLNCAFEWLKLLLVSTLLTTMFDVTKTFLMGKTQELNLDKYIFRNYKRNYTTQNSNAKVKTDDKSESWPTFSNFQQFNETNLTNMLVAWYWRIVCKNY